MDIILNNYWIFITLAIVVGFYMTWGIGANDVANAMGTSVGSKAITVNQAILIAAVFEFAGAFIAGGDVTKTIRKGIIDPASLEGNPHLLVYGMIAALLAAAIWLMVASLKGWPVSTTHSIVGAVVGFAVAGLGVDSVEWGAVGKIVASWIVSPLLGGVIAFFLMMSVKVLILNRDDPFHRAKRWGPLYIFLVGFVVTLVSVFKGLKHLNLELGTGESVLLAAGVGVFVAVLGGFMIKRVKEVKHENPEAHQTSVERVFIPMMIFTACAMAFAHGSNDVANGIGPVAAILSVCNAVKDGAGSVVAQEAALPVWVLLMGGVGIVIGLATLGHRVMRTIGEKITALTPSSGFCATLAAASTVALASKTGLPVSTTHIAVGAVMGVGFAKGAGALDFRMIGRIVISWIVTLPVGGILAAIFFFILKAIFG